jgi:hypothetical protein
MSTLRRKLQINSHIIVGLFLVFEPYKLTHKSREVTTHIELTTHHKNNNQSSNLIIIPVYIII